jgi:hypothetical protein
MPVEAELCRDGRVLVYTMIDPLTMEEFDPLALSYEKCFDEKSRHVIVDAMQLSRFPANIFSFYFHKTNLPERIKRPDFGYTIVATQTHAIRVIMGVSTRVIPSEKIILVGSVDEACQTIDKILENDI